MRARRITLVGLFALLTFICGFIRVPVGPVPITLQTAMVILTGVLLRPEDAAMAMVVHLLLRFTQSGMGLVFEPSFGFLIGYILAAVLASMYFHRVSARGWGLLVSVALAAVLPYLVGLPYMAFIINVINDGAMGLARLLQVGFLVFVPGDLAKAGLAYVLAKRLLPAFDSFYARSLG